MNRGTPEWHAWRKQGIGSSDAPVVMEISPWKTRYQLWREKVEGVVDDKWSFPMFRGLLLEDKARTIYEQKVGFSAPAEHFTHDVHPYIRACLDGWNADQKRILEIKCPGRKDHELALSGKIPPKYIPQLQHQLLVTRAEGLDYFSFDGERGVIIHVEPDPEYISRLFEEELKFWWLVKTKKPPELRRRDLKELHPIIQKWRKLKSQKLQSPTL